VILHTLGQILRGLAWVFLVPAAIDAANGATHEAIGFAATAALTLALGTLMARARAREPDVGRIEALVIVALLWMVVALLGAIPYVLQGLPPADGVFESMSGFTGTGASVFGSQHWSSLSRGLLFWRSFSQWLGGLGIIVLFIAVFPALAVGGRQMFAAETAGIAEDETLAPRVRFVAKRLWRLYLGLTALEVICLRYLGGLDLYAATCHAFSTMSAGGFSPYARSAAALGYVPQLIILPFMFLAGTSFSLQHRALRKPSLLVRDPEFRLYFLIVLFAGLTVALIIAPQHSFGGALRHGFFQVVSVITATGFASEDFAHWHKGALVVLGALMFIGGCAGSASGGPKVVRVLLLAKFIGREILFVIHPRAVRPVRLRGKPVRSENLRQIIGFLLSYFALFVLTATAVGVLEDDLNVGVTGSITTLGNIGPGFGKIGPMGGFGGLSVASKLMLVFNMWAGRLEVMAVLVLLHPDVLRMFVPHGRTRPAT
jgi:trk system potassium uptake protein TrkH